MDVSLKLVNFVKKKEDFRSTPYREPNGEWAYGYGEKAPNRYATITEPEASINLIQRLESDKDKILAKYGNNPNLNLNQNQNLTDGLTSFAYNLGLGAVDQVTQNGTRTVSETINMMPEYKNIRKNGVLVPSDGLYKRRLEEARISATPNTDQTTDKTYDDLGVSATSTSVDTYNRALANMPPPQAASAGSAATGRGARTEQAPIDYASLPTDAGARLQALGHGAPNYDDQRTLGTQAYDEVGIEESGIVFDPRENPFKEFSTMTYSVSLYLLDPKQYNDFMNRGIKSVDGLTLFIQSGGAPSVGKAGIYGAKRSEFFHNDFYLDEIKLEAMIAPKATLGSHNTFKMSFTITEPAGITFIESLYQMVHTEMNMQNYAAQPYLMVVRFYGYDEDGKQVRGHELNSVKQSLSDPVAVSEKYIPFMFTAVNFKLVAGKVVYSCEAVCPQTKVPRDTTHASSPAVFSIEGQTLKDVLQTRLMDVLNVHAESVVATNNYEHQDVYKVRFEDGLGEQLVLQGETHYLNSTPFDRTNKSSSVNFGSSIKVLINQKKFEITAGVNIVKLLDVVVQSSKYISDQVSDLRDAVTGNSSKNELSSDDLAWFKINTEVRYLEFDKKRNDYAYEITYVISKYEFHSDSTYVAKKEKHCFDIHKTYDYWFTGNNTEVIDFSQEYNFLYYTTMSSMYKNDNERPVHYNLNNLKSTVRNYMQYNGLGSEVYGNNESTNIASTIGGELYSPADHAKATIDLVGDPDFIGQGELFYSPSQMVKNGDRDKMFLRDGSVNYDKSEIHFIINYNTVVDYDLTTGLADVNKGVDGINIVTGKQIETKYALVYQAYQVTTLFEKGKFTQRLEGVLKDIKPTCLGKRLPENAKRYYNPDDQTTAASQNRLNNTSSQRMAPTTPNNVVPQGATPSSGQGVNDGDPPIPEAEGDGSKAGEQNNPQQTPANKPDPVGYKAENLANAFNKAAEFAEEQATSLVDDVVNEAKEVTGQVWKDVKNVTNRVTGLFTGTPTTKTTKTNKTNNEDDM